MVFVPSVISFDLFVFVEEDLNCFKGFMVERREVLEIAKDEDDEVVKNLVLNNESIKNRLQGLTIRKVIVVKNKIVNIVAN